MKVGDSVFVEATHNDIFNNDFVGTIQKIHNQIITVSDMDGDCWQVNACQCKLENE